MSGKMAEIQNVKDVTILTRFFNCTLKLLTTFSYNGISITYYKDFQ